MSRALHDLAAGVLTRDAFPGAMGEGVRVAVIDSGIDTTRADRGAVLPGVAIDAAGARGADTVDRHGHGTTVVRTIRAIAPRVAILPVKVFDRELRATADALVAAIDWAVGAGADLVNLSLGTTNLAHRLKLGEALVRAARAGVAVVAADTDDARTAWLPGSLPLAVGVSIDGTVPRGTAIVSMSQEGVVRRLRARANGIAMGALAVAADGPGGGASSAISASDRDAMNTTDISGVSFAVATVTGLLALHLSTRTRR